jgi:peptide deformylase
MSVRSIVQSGDPVLAGPISEVHSFGPELSSLIADLKDTLHAHKIAVGLAAPQIGVAQSVAVINLKTPDFKTLVLINPSIVSESGKLDKKKESCMSLRNKRGEVLRREKLVANYLDELGEQKVITATKFLARVLAHEIDHLSGKLYTSRMSNGAELETVDFEQWECESHRPGGRTT